MATSEKVKQVASHINQCKKNGQSVLAVVSAMGKTTDELVKKAYEVSNQPDRRELDMLLTTGERVSMALLCMALKDLNCDAISFTGSQAGLFTDGSHSDARIKDIKPFRVEEELQKGRVVVLAGFQGVNPDTKEITTLGRGGSDTTAVAMAAHFQSVQCEIIKEVQGVCSADPALVSNSRLLSQLDYKSLSHMCFWGAKVLHYRSVELAHKLKVPLTITSLDKESTSTIVKEEVHMYEDQTVLSVNSHEQVFQLKASVSTVDEALDQLHEILKKNKWPMPTILEANATPSGCDIWLTGDSENLKLLLTFLDNHKSISAIQSDLSSVTLTCYGRSYSELVIKGLDRLKEVSIGVHKVIQDSNGITFFIDRAHRDLAVKSLHSFVRN